MKKVKFIYPIYSSSCLIRILFFSYTAELVLWVACCAVSMLIFAMNTYVHVGAMSSNISWRVRSSPMLSVCSITPLSLVKCVICAVTPM